LRYAHLLNVGWKIPMCWSIMMSI